MRFARLFSALGAVAALGAAAAPAALAAPTDNQAVSQQVGQPFAQQYDPRYGPLAGPVGQTYSQQTDQQWYRYANPAWDQSSTWYRQSFTVQPSTGFDQAVQVRLAVPGSVVPTFATPDFLWFISQNLLPTLTQVVPAQYLVQAPVRFVYVQPNQFVVAHPSLYWGLDDVWAAYQYAAWLSAYGYQFQPYTFTGPQGHGVYLAFHGSPFGGWGH